MDRRTFVAALPLAALPQAHAHHGWGSFDQTKPLWLSGRVGKVAWRNPHAEFELEVDAEPKLPADLAGRPMPAQSAPVDAPALLKAVRLPTRRDRRWQVELAPISRMEAWKVAPLKGGEHVELIGFTFPGEKGDAVLRVEYLFVGSAVYALRSSPA